jgi:hypothetical protein
LPALRDFWGALAAARTLAAALARGLAVAAAFMVDFSGCVALGAASDPALDAGLDDALDMAFEEALEGAMHVSFADGARCVVPPDRVGGGVRRTGPSVLFDNGDASAIR